MHFLFPEGRDNVISTLRRATLLKTDDSGTQQILKQLRGLASEQFSDIYRAQQHGFSSHAPSGSEGIFIALGGRSDRIVAIGFEHKDKRPRDLPEGGTAIYDADGKILKFVKDNTDWDAGNKPWSLHNVTTITVHASGKIVIQSDAQVVVKAPHVDLGDEGGSAVVTVAGPSSKVFAAL